MTEKQATAPSRELDAQEPAPYGIGSDHWPGVGKAVEEMNEMGVVLGKLFGSGGERHHWSGDLVQMMREEIADVRAALRFLEDFNEPIWDDSGAEQISAREQWKYDLFVSWHSGDAESDWPQPESYGLPPRPSKQGTQQHEDTA